MKAGQQIRVSMTLIDSSLYNTYACTVLKSWKLWMQSSPHLISTPADPKG